MKETFRNIHGYEGYYQVSNKGTVRSLRKNKLLKYDMGNGGYRRVQLYNNGKKRRFSVHRLMVMTFRPNADLSLVIDHKDGVKINNFLFNLESVTQSVNVKRAIKLGLRRYK